MDHVRLQIQSTEGSVDLQGIKDVVLRCDGADGWIIEIGWKAGSLFEAPEDDRCKFVVRSPETMEMPLHTGGVYTITADPPIGTQDSDSVVIEKTSSIGTTEEQLSKMAEVSKPAPPMPSEDKPKTTLSDIYGIDPDFTGGLTPEEFLRRRHAGEDTCSDNSPPAPSTDPKRPDVEEMREIAKDLTGGEWATIMPAFEKVYDYALAVEKERDALKVAYGKAMDQVEGLENGTEYNRARSQITTLKAKLDQNKCNSGHRTLPLALWDCPECVRINREALEAKLKEVERERDHLKEIEIGASFALFDDLNAANSLLADLVEAVEEDRKSYLTENYRSDQEHKNLTIALTAAKQHLKGKEKKDDAEDGSKPAQG